MPSKGTNVEPTFQEVGGQFEIINYTEEPEWWYLFPAGAQVAIGRYKDAFTARLAAIMLLEGEEDERTTAIGP